MVRTFPRTTRRRVTVALAACSLLLSTAAIPLASADDLKHKKREVRQEIRHARVDLDHSSSRLQAATARLQRAERKLRVAKSHLAASRGQLAGARSLDAQMQAKLAAAVQRLEDARDELDTGRAKIADQQRTLGQIVVQNYQTGDPSLLGLSMVLTSQDPAELTGQLNSVQNVLDKESVTLDRLEASKVLLIVQERGVAAAKVEVAEKRAAAAANLVVKKRLEAEAEADRAEVATLVAAHENARRKAAKARAHDRAELRKLEHERDRISALLRKRAEAARRRAARNRTSSSSATSDGVLMQPVSSYITSPFGWRTHPIFGYRSLHDGIDFGGGCGTPILASASGRVLEEYFQTAWGKRLIIDHGYRGGAGLATIYNHLSSYTVSSGQYVQRGQVIGYMGSTGWSTGCHLHFTVMRNGVPVNPVGWF